MHLWWHGYLYIIKISFGIFHWKKFDNSSAVDEMGDHLATTHIGWKEVGSCCAPFRGAGSPSNTMLPGLRLPTYQVASWSIQPFGHNRHGPKIGGRGAVPFRGKLNLTQCGRDRGLPPCQVSSWSIQLFGHNTPTLQIDRTGQTGQRSDSIERTI